MDKSDTEASSFYSFEQELPTKDAAIQTGSLPASQDSVLLGSVNGSIELDRIDAGQQTVEADSNRGSQSQHSPSGCVESGSGQESEPGSESRPDRGFIQTLKRMQKILWERFTATARPFMAYNAILIMLDVTAIILVSLLVAGCASSSTLGIYLMSLSYRGALPGEGGSPSSAANPLFYTTAANISHSADLEVRVGYFGFCMARPSASPEAWTCGSNASDLAASVTSVQDPLNLLAMADNFQNQVVLSVLAIMATIFLLISSLGFLTIPRWRDEADENGSIMQVLHLPSLALMFLCLGLNLMAVILLLVAVLWQHVAAVAHSATVKAAFGGVVHSGVGDTAMGLGWGAMAAAFVAAIGTYFIFLGVRLLRTSSEE